MREQFEKLPEIDGRIKDGAPSGATHYCKPNESYYKIYMTDGIHIFQDNEWVFLCHVHETSFAYLEHIKPL